jgi:hypothetical protein
MEVGGGWWEVGSAKGREHSAKGIGYGKWKMEDGSWRWVVGGGQRKGQ